MKPMSSLALGVACVLLAACPEVDTAADGGTGTPDGSAADAFDASIADTATADTATTDTATADTAAADASSADAGEAPAATGDPIWSRGFGEATTQVVNALAVDRSGAVVAAGAFEGSVDFGGGVLESAGGFDVFAVKLDASGQLLWSRAFGSDGRFEQAYAAGVNGDGDVVLAGSFDGHADFGGGALQSAGGEDVFVAKLDAGGQHLWSQRWGGSDDYQVAHAVALDGAGDVVVAGEFQGTLDLGGAQLVSAGAADAFVVKLDAAGNHLWSRGFGDDMSQVAMSVAVDPTGQVLVAGETAGSVDFGGGAIAGGGGSDPFVAKLDAAGNHLWSKVYGDAANRQIAVAVAADGSGNVYLGVHFEGTVNFGGEDMVNDGYRAKDVALVKLDPEGDHLWSKHFGDEDPQNLSALAVDRWGAVAIAGTLRGEIDFGGGAMRSASYTTYVAKFDADGAHLWSRQLTGGEAAADIGARALAAGPGGELALGGQFWGEVDFGDAVLSSASGDYDAFVALSRP